MSSHLGRRVLLLATGSASRSRLARPQAVLRQVTTPVFSQRNSYFSSPSSSFASSAKNVPSSSTQGGETEGGEEGTNAQETPLSEDTKTISLLQTQLAERDAKIADLQDAFRRAIADAENVRNRTKKEVDDTAAFSISKFAKEVLDIADVLDIALKSVPPAALQDPAQKQLVNLYEGVGLTRKEVTKVFAKFGITQYEKTEGEQFNPQLHEAIFQIPPSEGKAPGTILSIVETGYWINGRVLRPARVGVVKME